MKKETSSLSPPLKKEGAETDSQMRLNPWVSQGLRLFGTWEIPSSLTEKVLPMGKVLSMGKSHGECPSHGCLLREKVDPDPGEPEIGLQGDNALWEQGEIRGSIVQVSMPVEFFYREDAKTRPRKTPDCKVSLTHSKQKLSPVNPKHFNLFVEPYQRVTTTSSKRKKQW